MFGYAAFAQPAFAALAGGANVYAVSITEAILSEADSEAVSATFIAFIAEALAVADTPSSSLNSGVFVVENINTAAYGVGTKIFNAAITEPINLLDAPIGFAWVKIDNTEGTTWTLIDNRQ